MGFRVHFYDEPRRLIRTNLLRRSFSRPRFAANIFNTVRD